MSPWLRPSVSHFLLVLEDSRSSAQKPAVRVLHKARFPRLVFFRSGQRLPLDSTSKLPQDDSSVILACSHLKNQTGAGWHVIFDCNRKPLFVL
jgi:hypothetical protein